MRNLKACVIGGVAVLAGVMLWQPSVALAGLGSPTGAFGSIMVAGGKKADSDCYMELQAFGFDGSDVDASKKGAVVTCTVGDPCDQSPSDSTCGIAVKVCINQTDPSAACTPPAELEEIKLKGKGKNGGLVDIQLPSVLSGSVCFGTGGAPSSVAGAFGLPSSIDGAFVMEVPVGELKSNGKLKGGSVTIAGKAKALKGTKPKVDPDKFTFECRPRPASPTGAFVN